jgi:conflict system STAND superfamily ATPase
VTTRIDYRLDELGWLQFEQLCTELLVGAGVERHRWEGSADDVRTAVVETLDSSALGLRLVGPTLVVVAWARSRARCRNVRAWVRDEAGEYPVVLLTNAYAADLDLEGSGAHVLGLQEIGAALDAAPSVRRQVPFVLGVRELTGLVDHDVLGRSTADVEAAVSLARVFVPTQAYRRTLGVLDQHGFAVVTGPPEMGKTAIARTIGLAALSSGWELHEVTQPDEFWQAFARDRKQLFIADDAFGSTEYRPDAAERWAFDLDRVLRAMDDDHHLIWTSRPAPLRAGLRRVHREHGVERWPQPAEVQVDATALELEEKALILFRHTQAAQASAAAVALVREHAEDIVEHEHFTPERIRRFVAQRLPALAADHDLTGDALRNAVTDEIREPTAAMAASLNALPAELRALLVALVDSAPGPVPERELALAARRHALSALPQAPAELVDRLTDHFVRLVPPDSVTWVHPSWRDLLIGQIAADAAQRSRFLASCGFDGLLLAFSTAGGVAGERELPLLVDDADWDLAVERVQRIVSTLDDHAVFRLLVTLGEALENAHASARAELQAIVGTTLANVQRAWDASALPIPVTVLAAWFQLVPASPEPVHAPDLATTWIDSVPTESVDLRAPDELRRLDEWVTLVELLRLHKPSALDQFGFPTSQHAALLAVVDSAYLLALESSHDERRELAAATLTRIARSFRDVAREALGAVDALRSPDPDTVDWWEPRLPPARPHAKRPREHSIIKRILRDLRPAS